MNCQEGMELMQRYVDHDLNEEETSRLLEHAGQCPDCASMLNRLVQLSRGLEKLPRVAPPFSLVDAILPELSKIEPEAVKAPAAAQPESAEPAARRTPESRRRQWNYRTWIPRISSIAAVGVIAWLLLINRPDADLPGSHQEASMPEAAPAQEWAAAQASDMRISQDSSADIQPFAGSAEKQSSVEEDADRNALFVTPTASRSEPSAESQGSSNSSQNFERSEVGVPEAGEIHFMMDLPPAEEAPVSMMGVAPEAEEAVSPDGQWRAVIAGGVLQLYRMSDNSLIYDQAPDIGTRSGLIWSEDSTTLQYTFTDSEGNQIPMELRIEDSAIVEIKR